MFPFDTVNFVYMRAERSNSQLFADGQQFEKAGKWEDAAAAYQRVVDNDPGDQEAVARLLVVYRKLKDYPRELAVIDAAINAVAERDKTAQREWISAHPEAAKLGKAVLKQLGGESVTAYGTDPFVEKLMKRRALVEKRAGAGKKRGKASRKKVSGDRKREDRKDGAAPGRKNATTTAAKGAAASARKEAAARKKEKTETRKKKVEEKKGATAARKVEAERERKETVARKAEAERQREQAKARQKEAERKQAAAKEEAERKRKEAEERKAAAERKKKEAEERKAAKKAEAEKRRAEKEAKAHPSLFIVSLRYLVPLERIDAAMKDHVAFLDKHFAKKEFLAAGRLVPRTGGIILARAKDREAVEKIMKQDPFVKRKLAGVDIVEFVASKMDKRLRLVSE